MANNFLEGRKKLQENAEKIWGLKNISLINKTGVVASDFSLADFLKLFQFIYSKTTKNWRYLQEKLKTSRNIYYLFDQLELEILGSKSGTGKLDGLYWISDCGIFKKDGKTYFMGAIVSNKKISSAVLRIRKVGKELLSKLT